MLKEKAPELYANLGLSTAFFGWNFFIIKIIFNKQYATLDGDIKFRSRAMFFTWFCEFVVLILFVSVLLLQH